MHMESQRIHLVVHGKRYDQFIEIYADLTSMIKTVKLNYVDVVYLFLDFYKYCRENEECWKLFTNFLDKWIKKKMGE